MSAVNLNVSKISSIPEQREAKTQEQETPIQASSEVISTSLEKAKKEGEILKALMEKKIENTKQTLAPLFRLAKIYNLPFYYILHATLLIGIESIKRECVPNVNVDKKKIPAETAQLQKSISLLFWNLNYVEDNVKEDCFACLEKWNTFSENFSHANDSKVKFCNNFFNILPLIIGSKIEELCDQNLSNETSPAQLLSEMTSDASLSLYQGLILLVQQLQYETSFILKEMNHAIDAEMSSSKCPNDPIKTFASTVDTFWESTHQIWVFFKDTNLFLYEFQQKVDFDYPKSDFFQNISDFYKNSAEIQIKSSEYFKKTDAISKNLKAKVGEITYSSLPRAQFFSDTLLRCCTSIDQSLQILGSLNTFLQYLQAQALTFITSSLEILAWKKNHFPKENLFSICELYFLHFFATLEELQNLEDRKALEKKFFTLFNQITILFDVFETQKTTVEGFRTSFDKVLCPCAQELKESLYATLALTEDTEKHNTFFQSFTLFVDFLQSSPQSLSIFYLRSTSSSKEAKEENQRLLIQNLKFYRQYVESIDFTEIENLLKPLKIDNANVEVIKNRLQKYVKEQKRQRNLFLAMVPKEISLEMLESKIKEIHEFFVLFSDSYEGNLFQIHYSVGYLQSLLKGKERDIRAHLNIGAFQHGCWSFTPSIQYYIALEDEKQKTKRSFKTSRSSFVKPSDKKTKGKEEKSEGGSTSRNYLAEISILDTLSFQTKQASPPVEFPPASPLERELRFIQFEMSLENIDYYVSLLSELLTFTDPLTFPLSFGYLLELYSTLTLEQSEKTVLAHLPMALNDAPAIHVLFRGMPGSSQTQVRSSHHVEELWDLLEKKRPKAFSKTAEQKKHLSACAFSIISARYPISRKKKGAIAELWGTHLAGKPEAMLKKLDTLFQNAFSNLSLSHKALNYFASNTPPVSKFLRPYKEIIPCSTESRIQELLDLLEKLKAKGTSQVDRIALNNLPFALMLTNEMFLFKDRLKIPQCYAQVLASAPFVVLELCTLLSESFLKLKHFEGLAHSEWESHDLSDFLELLKRDDLFTKEEKNLFEIVQSVLKTETRYPKSFYGDISEDLLKLETLCKWREALKPEAWRTEEMLYEIKMAYKKDIDPSLLSDIEKDMTQLLDKFQRRAELALSASQKVLRLLL